MRMTSDSTGRGIWSSFSATPTNAEFVEGNVATGDVKLTLRQEMQRIYGPMFIWVVLDGNMTRDVRECGVTAKRTV